LTLLPVPLWLLDEPTTNLDAEGRELVAELVREHLAHGGIVVAAVHQGLPSSVRNVTRLELAA
jgi:heme exporter protein A